MSDTARLVLFSLAMTVGAALAALKVISGDAWLTLTLGLLLPSPLDVRKSGPGSGSVVSSGISVLVLGTAIRAFALMGPREATA